MLLEQQSQGEVALPSDNLKTLNNRELLIHVATIVDTIMNRIDDHEVRLRSHTEAITQMQQMERDRQTNDTRRLTLIAIIATLGGGAVDFILHFLWGK